MIHCVKMKDNKCSRR